jgi:hypothetical protein
LTLCAVLLHGANAFVQPKFVGGLSIQSTVATTVSPSELNVYATGYATDTSRTVRTNETLWRCT